MTPVPPSEPAAPGQIRKRLVRRVREPGRSPLQEVAIGLLAALVAVAIRYSLPISPMQLPMLTVVIALALVTTFVGVIAGATTAVVGGLLSWYIFFTPFAFDLTPEVAVPLFGFVVIAIVIVTATHLYRTSERRHHEAQLALLEEQAMAADLFARELSHRLKNALAIIQSIAAQTLESGRDDTKKFAGRLYALAGAHDLLSTDVEAPTADVRDVIGAGLEPFRSADGRIRVDCPETRILGQQAVTLALALHELGTNALKYGALSNDEGWVSLKVEEKGEELALAWKEHDGPPVGTPGGRGFGMRLLNRIGAGTELLFEPDGLRAHMLLRKC
ncbi:MAG TPA: sensor histidine kinase [Allosphingosinicella sp.]